MELFWKTAALVLLGVILVLTVGRQEKDLALVLTLAVCCMSAGAAVSLLEPVLDFLYELELLGDLQAGVLGILMKIAGVGLVTELMGMLCQDAGCGALGKSVQLLGSAMILNLSIPIFRMLVQLIQGILGEL